MMNPDPSLTMTAPILIYGATGGIGSTLARRLHTAGRPLHLVARDPVKLSALANELQAPFTVADVLDPDSFRTVQDAAGPTLSGLVYAIGSITLKPLSRLTPDDFLHDYRLNALGAAQAVQAALPALKKAEGTASVVLFSSIAATQGFAFHASIGMAKAAVNGLVLSLAAELAPKVRVNAVAPSLTKTGLASGILANEKTEQAIAEMHPLPRLGEAGDTAAMAAFLLSPESGWITGQVFAVDGGRSTLRVKG